DLPPIEEQFACCSEKAGRARHAGFAAPKCERECFCRFLAASGNCFQVPLIFRAPAATELADENELPPRAALRRISPEQSSRHPIRFPKPDLYGSPILRRARDSFEGSPGAKKVDRRGRQDFASWKFDPRQR